jgi:hypothetical protein
VAHIIPVLVGMFMMNIAGEALLKPDFQRLLTRQPLWTEKTQLQRPSSRSSQDKLTTSLRFGGGDKPLKAHKPQVSAVFKKLFGDPAKNLTWSLGYSVGGVLLLPIPAAATSAFCLAGVHLLSATYQFLTRKTDQASPASVTFQSAGRNALSHSLKKQLSVLA